MSKIGIDLTDDEKRILKLWHDNSSNFPEEAHNSGVVLAEILDRLAAEVANPSKDRE